MNKKAVKIDLSTFFDDERKMTCVLVDPNWKSVECLQKRIEYLFGVESVRFLSDGYFLPPQESIEIVRFCYDLKAFVPKDVLEKRKKKKSKKSKNNKKSIDNEESTSNEEITLAKPEVIIDSHKKRKSTSLGNEAKRTKSSVLSEITGTSEAIPPTLPQHEIDEVCKSKNSKPKISKVSLTTTNHEEQKRLEECNSEIITAGNATNLEENTLVQRNSVNEPKKRLTSTPKEKNSLEIMEDREEKTFNNEMKTAATRHSSIPSSTFLNESKMIQQQNNIDFSNNSSNPNNPFKKPKSSRGHIYFNDSGEMVNPSTLKNDKETKTIVIFRCPLSDITDGKQKPRIFNLKSKNNTQKQKVEIQEEIIIPPPTKGNNSPNKESFVLNERDNNKENGNNVKELDSLNEKCSLNNTTNASNNTTIAKDKNDKELKINKVETNVSSPTTNTESEIQLTTANEMSIISVDCVDLSMDLDEDDKIGKLKTPATKSKKNIEEKHDLTRDDEDNKSSTSDVEEISEVIYLNDTEDNYEDSVNNSTIHSTSIKDIKVHKILPFSVNINSMPNVGDVIVFKMRYVNNKQKYIRTNYIAGKAEYINRRTKTIKICIIDGASELIHIPNQFICNLDESQDNLKYIQVKFSEMYEPKLFTSY